MAKLCSISSSQAMPLRQQAGDVMLVRSSLLQSVLEAEVKLQLNFHQSRHSSCVIESGKEAIA